MYETKREGGNRHKISDPHARLAADRRANLEWDLMQAQHLDQLELQYQLIVKLDTGELVAVEALLRWNHPDDGMIMPEMIIPSAERS